MRPRAPTRCHPSPPLSRSTVRASGSKRCHAATRSRAGSAGPNPPPSSTPARRSPADEQVAGDQVAVRQNVGSRRAGRTRNSVQSSAQAMHVEQALALTEADGHPLVFGLQVSTPSAARERSSSGVRRSERLDEHGDISGERRGVGEALGGGLAPRRATSAPTTVKGSRGRRVRSPRARGRGRDCRPPARQGGGLGPQKLQRAARRLWSKGKASGQVLADPEDRIDRARPSASLGDRLVAPLRKLLGDQPARDVEIDMQLVVVHPHAMKATPPQRGGSARSPRRADHRRRRARAGWAHRPGCRTDGCRRRAAPARCAGRSRR